MKLGKLILVSAITCCYYSINILNTNSLSKEAKRSIASSKVEVIAEDKSKKVKEVKPSKKEKASYQLTDKKISELKEKNNLIKNKIKSYKNQTSKLTSLEENDFQDYQKREEKVSKQYKKDMRLAKKEGDKKEIKRLRRIKKDLNRLSSSKLELMISKAMLEAFQKKNERQEEAIATLKVDSCEQKKAINSVAKEIKNLVHKQNNLLTNILSPYDQGASLSDLVIEYQAREALRLSQFSKGPLYYTPQPIQTFDFNSSYSITPAPFVFDRPDLFQTQEFSFLQQEQTPAPSHQGQQFLDLGFSNRALFPNTGLQRRPSSSTAIQGQQLEFLTGLSFEFDGSPIIPRAQRSNGLVSSFCSFSCPN